MLHCHLFSNFDIFSDFDFLFKTFKFLQNVAISDKILLKAHFFQSSGQGMHHPVLPGGDARGLGRIARFCFNYVVLNRG